MKKREGKSRSKLLHIIDKAHRADFFESVYPPEVVKHLAACHGLTQFHAELSDALSEATINYICGGPFAFHDSKEVRDRHRSYLKLARQAEELGETLLALEDRLAANLLNEMTDCGAVPAYVKGASGDAICDTDRRARFFCAYTAKAISRRFNALAARVDPTQFEKPRRRMRSALEGKHPTRGRPEEYGLEGFVAALAYFWEAAGKRRFTVDYHRGSPTTPALAFLSDALAKLDDVPTTALITAARKIRKEMGAHRK